MDPVFLFGVDHSGTTVVYRMLAYHPDLVWFSQFTLRDGSIPGRSRRPGAGFFEPLLRFIPHAWDKGDPAWRRWLGPRPGEEGQIWDHLLTDRAAAPGAVRECLTEFAERHGGKRVLAKRPAFGSHLEILNEAFPRARFVHIVRDGRAVAMSVGAKLTAAGSPEVAPPQTEAVRVAAHGWVEALDRVAAAAPGIALLELRYEDFCADVHGALRTVLQHARLDPERFPFRRCPRKLEVRNAPWLEAASERQLAEITAIEHEMLARHGYESGSGR